MNGFTKHANYLAIVLAEAQHVSDVLQEQDKKIALLEAEAQHLALRNSELLDELNEVRDQRDAVVRAHNQALAKIAEIERGIR